jgi:putative membrane-bound dehydrogenase-like protein
MSRPLANEAGEGLPMCRRAVLSLLVLIVASTARAGDGNRLTYLDDGANPYYVGRDFPRLTTPQWVGEEGVEAVVVLAVDDMTDNAPRYETFLRPILDRLKAIDGRAPVSIMTCRIDPKSPKLQAWLKEGVHIDVHTLTHPWPLLQKGDFPEAARVYHGCVDLLGQIPGNHPVAFRMPYCDSKNTVSPRFFKEIFNRPSPEGHFLTIDSSVFNITTPNDPSLPRGLVLDADGRERFRKYVPFPSFVNTIEDYPYPYVIGRLCWEFPCIVPSDWEAQNLHKPYNPRTVEDLKAALDAVVLKRGVFDLVFHPHGWIKGEQVVELIDHAVAKHGKKVKFLNFREAQERLDKNLLGGQPLRASDGEDNGVRLLDLDDDGFLDVAIGNESRRETRLWDPKAGRWKVGEFPTTLVTRDGAGHRRDAGSRFGASQANGPAGRRDVMLLVRNEETAGQWHFRSEDMGWRRAGESGLLRELAGAQGGRAVFTSQGGLDRGARFRDIDGDGLCELIVANEAENLIFAYAPGQDRWSRLEIGLPPGARVVDEAGRDAGLRFVDLDEDGRDDVIFANDRESGAFLFESLRAGWSRRVPATSPGEPGAIPPIVRGGTDNGAWVHSRHLWWQNEDTAKLPDLVDRRAFNDLLKEVEPRGKSPAASLASIRVRPGFKVELVASEPLVTDPIAFDWGADGKLWVVEMGDYPLGADGKGKPGGVVRILEDADGDGRYDKSTTFLDGLAYPTGVLAWRKGVLVAAAPDILYAEDRDGDGMADVRRVLFTGFHRGNPQHLINGFDFGLDGWIYGANGDSGGDVGAPGSGRKVGIRGRDFRFRPDDGRFEAESGQTQYGRHRDDWADWFGNSNPIWGWHYVLADQDLRRNPKVAFGDPRKVLDPDTRLYPVSRTVARFNDLNMANRVTSANSPTPYRDEMFGPGFERALFVSEPVHNLVHRVVVEPDGPTFRGRRAPDEADREFLASSDNWFRPTMLKTGPDGALWVADMYRAVIEHPEWIPDDWEKRLDLRAGHDQGRIYRVYPVDQSPRRIPRLDRLDTPGLVSALDSPNGWQRDTAQRLLLHAADPAAVVPLRRLAADSPRPKARVQALWTLDCLGASTAEVVSKALADAHPEVRRQAARIAEGLVKDHPEVGEALARLADDAEVRVRFQAALSLGAWDDPRAGRALARVVRRDGNDPWMRSAVLSSALPQAATILSALFAESRDEPPPAAVVEPLFASAASAPGSRSLAALLDEVVTPRDGAEPAPWQLAALAGLLDAAERSRTPLDRLAGEGPEGKAIRERLRARLADARRLAEDDRAAEERRLPAIRLLGREPSGRDADRGADRAALQAMLRPQAPAPVQQAAVAALARTRDDKVPEVLLADWRSHSPALRAAILDALLSRESWSSALLSAIEAGQPPAAEIDPAHRRTLLSHRDPAHRRRASALFAAATAARQEVINRYRATLATPGDAQAGAAVFRKSCTPCHRLRGEGTEVGPDLAALTDKSPDALLVAILDPNRAFEAKFAGFTVYTTDGRVLTGLIATETATSVTLRRQEGKEDVLLRADIEGMAGSGQSLMPEGLEKDLSPKAVTDLIAYLGSTGPARKEVAGNRPELVRPGANGTLVLRAEVAEIYGSTLVFEPQYRNLGYWSSPDDHAAWTFETDRPGRYHIWLNWACADGSHGNAYVVEVGPNRVEGTVAGTGSWDDYRTAKVGELSIPAGKHRLELRPSGSIRGALIDLKAIELRPRGD